MNAAAWASVAAFCVVQAVTLAFLLGGLFQRVRALEGRKDGSDCSAALAKMEATLDALKESVTQRIGSLEQTVQRIMAPKPTRRTQGD